MTTSFVNKKDGSRDFYYKCTTKSRFGSSKCASRDIYAHELENFIEQLLIKIASSDYLFDSVFSQLSHNENSDLKRYEEQKVSLITNRTNIYKEITNLTNFISKSGLIDMESITSKLKELENQKELIMEELNKVEKEIDLIKNSNIKKSDLKDIFKDIDKYYNLASVEEKKYMIKTIIRDIKIRLKKNEDQGEIDIHFRGDGLIKKEWVNKTVNPEKLVSSYYLDWLREPRSISLRGISSGNFRTQQDVPFFR